MTPNAKPGRNAKVLGPELFDHPLAQRAADARGSLRNGLSKPWCPPQAVSAPIPAALHRRQRMVNAG